MSAPNIGQALAPHPAPSGASGEDWMRLAFVTGFEQAKHNDSLTADQFYDEWAHAGFPAARIRALSPARDGAGS